MSTKASSHETADKSTFNWELIERVTVAGPDGSGRKRWRAIPSVELGFPRSLSRSLGGRSLDRDSPRHDSIHRYSVPTALL